jgi:hypothetical protein
VQNPKRLRRRDAIRKTERIAHMNAIARLHRWRVFAKQSQRAIVERIDASFGKTRGLRFELHALTGIHRQLATRRQLQRQPDAIIARFERNDLRVNAARMLIGAVMRIARQFDAQIAARMRKTKQQGLRTRRRIDHLSALLDAATVQSRGARLAIAVATAIANQPVRALRGGQQIFVARSKKTLSGFQRDAKCFSHQSSHSFQTAG